MEKKKVQMSLTGLIFLIILVAAIVGGLVYFFTNYDLQIMSKKELNKVSQVENKEEIEVSKVEELNKDSQLVKELYSIVLKYNNVVLTSGVNYPVNSIFSFYRDNKIVYSNLRDEEKVVCLLNSIKDEDYAENINIEDINLNLYQTEYKNYNVNYEQTKTSKRYSNVSNNIKRIFGKNAGIENKNYSLCPDIVEYYDDSYYIYMIEGGGLGNTQYGYSEIQKVEKEDDYIYIYDKFMDINLYGAWGQNEEFVYFYTSADETKEIAKEQYKNFGVWDDKNIDKNFEKFYKKYEDKLNTYRHMFKEAEDGTYYWVSSEIYEVVEDIDNLSKIDAEKKAKEVLDKYMDLQHFENGGIGPAPYIFAELELMSEKEVSTLENNHLGTDPSVYIKSNVEYKKFKDALLNYVTEDYFEKNFSHYTNMDGYVGVCCTAGGIVVTEVEKVNLISTNENKYVFDVTLKDVEVYEHYLNPEEGENITEEECFFDLKVIFKLVNNKLVIDDWE